MTLPCVIDGIVVGMETVFLPSAISGVLVAIETVTLACIIGGIVVAIEPLTLSCVIGGILDAGLHGGCTCKGDPPHPHHCQDPWHATTWLSSCLHLLCQQPC